MLPDSLEEKALAPDHATELVCDERHNVYSFVSILNAIASMI
jgi:hypothetical protein